MNSRRICRESAMQALYLCDLIGDLSVERIELFSSHFVAHGLCEDGEPSTPGALDPYFHELVNGVLTHREAIDAAITLASTNWSLSRMAPVERNVLRVAVYELLHRSDVPPKVCINEAIEIAKDFASPEGPSFINGVLNTIAHQGGRSKGGSTMGEEGADPTSQDVEPE